MKFQDPSAAIALHRLEMLATVAAVVAAATFVSAATTLIAIEQADTAPPALPSEAALWQGLGFRD
jgi:hypothetical protein